MPSAQMGPDVPQTVEATTYNWKWHYSAPGFAIWIVLILAIALPRANHDRRVLLILVPVATVILLCSALSRIAGMSSASVVQFGVVVHSMALGTAALWLIAEYLKGFAGAVRFLLSFGTVVLVAASGILSYSAEFSNETALLLIFFIFLAGTWLTAIVLTRAICRKRHGPTHLMLWLALWTILASMITTLAFRIAGEFVMSSGPSVPRTSELLSMIFIVGPILGLGLYVLNLPFMILGFVNPFFRERLRNCLRLQPAAAPAMRPDADEV